MLHKDCSKKIHRAISFVSSKFLKEWIDLCTQKRIECVGRGDSIGKKKLETHDQQVTFILKNK